MARRSHRRSDVELDADIEATEVAIDEVQRGNDSKVAKLWQAAALQSKLWDLRSRKSKVKTPQRLAMADMSRKWSETARGHERLLKVDLLRGLQERLDKQEALARTMGG